MELFDAHLHLQLMANAAEVAAELASLRVGALACGVDPRSWEADRALLADVGTHDSPIAVAAGLHPWWLADGRCGSPEAELLASICARTRWIGELGLDFSARRIERLGKEPQVEALTRACAAAAAASMAGQERVLSLHSVRAAGTCLDVLERTGAATRCRCVFHWFSGTTDELWRAVRAGCWFSVNEMGLATGKGREYAKLIPAERLLLETDHPAELGGPWSAQRVRESLERALALVAAARKADPAELQAQLVANARSLLA